MSDELATSTSSPVVAHDDAGQPIIEDDLVWESYCRPVAGEKLCLLISKATTTIGKRTVSLRV
jgi:hypothetical protein